MLLVYSTSEQVMYDYLLSLNYVKYTDDPCGRYPFSQNRH